MTTAMDQSHRLFSQLAVTDAMSSGLISCTPDTPLSSVARLMAEHRVHAIFVFDFGSEDDETVELWGLVSDLDVVAAMCGDIEKRTARDSAVVPLVTIASTAPLEWAARLMAEHGVSHLATVDPVTQRPVGVISTLDIARTAAGKP
jgi:CBS domain-containing protein